MFGQITNKKGEELYILTSVSTNNIKNVTVIVDTWEKCMIRFNHLTIEKDSNRFFTQKLHKVIDDKTHLAEASMRYNRKKGQGSDFCIYITIRPLYTQSWE